MSRRHRYTYAFVDFIPDTLELGVLYISTRYATAAHLCMCGCGFESTTPLSPQQWQLIFDGQSVSLSPSVGNWSFECESHYWLEGGTVDWAARWSRDRIGAGRAATRQRIETAVRQDVSTPSPAAQNQAGWVRRFLDIFGR